MSLKVVHAQKQLFREVFPLSCGQMGPDYKLAAEFSNMIYLVLILQACKIQELLGYRV